MPDSAVRVIQQGDISFAPEHSTSVVSGAMKYVLAVPEGKGEALVYPETVTDAKGTVHQKGDPITDWQGNALQGEGVVVFNSSEKIYQAGVGGKAGDARSVIIINHVTEEQAARLDAKVNELTGGKPENITFDQFKEVERFARQELGLSNMYDSDVKFAKKNLQDPFTGKGGEEASPVGFKKRDARDRCMAVVVEGPAELQRNNGTALPIGPEGAVLLKQGDDVRVITHADFEATYRAADDFSPIKTGAVKAAVPLVQVVTDIASLNTAETAAKATAPNSPAELISQLVGESPEAVAIQTKGAEARAAASNSLLNGLPRAEKMAVLGDFQQSGKKGNHYQITLDYHTGASDIEALAAKLTANGVNSKVQGNSITFELAPDSVAHQGMRAVVEAKSNLDAARTAYFDSPHGRANPFAQPGTAAMPTRLAGNTTVKGAGVGASSAGALLGIKGLYDQLNTENGTYWNDQTTVSGNADQAMWSKANLTANVTATGTGLFAAQSEIAAIAGKEGLKGFGAASKAAGAVAIPAAVFAGSAEFAAAMEAVDGNRAARAAGSTLGAIGLGAAGGAGGGAVAGLPGMAVGGLGGGLIGAFTMGPLAETAFGQKLQTTAERWRQEEVAENIGAVNYQYSEGKLNEIGGKRDHAMERMAVAMHQFDETVKKHGGMQTSADVGAIDASRKALFTAYVEVNKAPNSFNETNMMGELDRMKRKEEGRITFSREGESDRINHLNQLGKKMAYGEVVEQAGKRHRSCIGF
jgi:hypothetical protein